MKRMFPLLLIICIVISSVSCGTKVITDTTTVYWVPNGTVYHIGKNCETLRRSKTVESGTISEAKADGKTRLCEVCGTGWNDETKTDSGIESDTN